MIRKLLWLGTRTMLALALLAPGASGPASADGTAQFAVSDDPDQLVIRFSEHIGEIESDDHPWLRVYADGRVVSHRPAYLRNPGEFTSQISADELHSLLQSLLDQGLMEFDSDSVKEQLSVARNRESTVFQASDVSRFEIEVHLQSFTPAEGAPQAGFQKVVSWQGLRADTKRYPEIIALQNLASACEELEQLSKSVEREAAKEVVK